MEENSKNLQLEIVPHKLSPLRRGNVFLKPDRPKIRVESFYDLIATARIEPTPARIVKFPLNSPESKSGEKEKVYVIKIISRTESNSYSEINQKKTATNCKVHSSCDLVHALARAGALNPAKIGEF